ncbi:MAG: hypothetical protein PHU46_14700 [Rhodocyclaceae bacterium]|nr:hypothetical protein [Rhodocyclaceae bacterium]
MRSGVIAILVAGVLSGCGGGVFDEAKVRKAISDTAYEYTDIDYRGGQQQGTVVTVSFDRAGTKCRMRAVRVSDNGLVTDLGYNLDSIVIGQCQSLNKTCAQIACTPEGGGQTLQVFVTETELGRGIHLFDSYILKK